MKETLENTQKKCELDNREPWLWQNQNGSHEVVEGDGGGYPGLGIQRGPTCLTPLQNLMIVEERQYVPSKKKSHNIYLHTNAFDSNLDRFYTPLHTSSQTHSYSTNPTPHF